VPVQDFIYRNNLPGAHGIQAHFNKRVNEIFTRHGKKMIGWDEIQSPDLPKNILIQSWRGAKGAGRERAQRIRRHPLQRLLPGSPLSRSPTTT
jgi:N-acetyl-beta-hexosaminidase